MSDGKGRRSRPFLRDALLLALIGLIPLIGGASQAPPPKKSTRAALLAKPVPSPRAVTINASPITRFDASGAVEFGKLGFRGGLVLTSEDPDFGGLSGMVIDPDGAGLLALTDRGYWVKGLIETKDGHPTGITDAMMAPLVAANGRPFFRGRLRDTESVSRAGNGFTVGIEYANEIYFFPGKDPLTSRGRPLFTGEPLNSLGRNEGIEAQFAPPGGKPAALVAIAEVSPTDPDILPGFLFSSLESAKLAGTFSIIRMNDFAATDATLSDDGMVYLLERRFDYFRGVAMRIRRFPLAEVKPGATIRGETLIEAYRGASIDNMEAIGLHRESSGELVITLLSDNNFWALQRTLLLQFTVLE